MNVLDLVIVYCIFFVHLACIVDMHTDIVQNKCMLERIVGHMVKMHFVLDVMVIVHDILILT